jgi:putative transposase
MEKRIMIDKQHEDISITRQCDLLDLPRSTYYYQPRPESEENLYYMKRIDEIHNEHITWGSRKIRDYLRNEGYQVNRKRIQRLMRKMQIQVIYPKQNLSRRNHEHHVYPYLLRNLEINRANQVWCSDITYIRLNRGFIYLTAIMDWYSKKILTWEVSTTPDRFFCVSALERSLRLYEQPEIFNTDQGGQYTSPDFTRVLKNKSIRISMDGKGRALDNIAIERFWRTLKYDEVYLHEYESVGEAKTRIGAYIAEYNSLRPHESIGGKTPDSEYFKNLDESRLA